MKLSKKEKASLLMKLSKKEKASLRWLVQSANEYGDTLAYGCDVWDYDDRLKEAKQTVRKIIKASEDDK